MATPIRRAAGACSVFFLFSALIAILAGRTAAFAADQGARERGATIFHTRGCERCHSILGVGGDRAPDLGTVGHRRSTDQIKTQVIKGGHGMPPFGNVLSKDEVKDVVAFLASCRTSDASGCRKWMPEEAGQ